MPAFEPNRLSDSESEIWLVGYLTTLRGTTGRSLRRHYARFIDGFSSLSHARSTAAATHVFRHIPTFLRVFRRDGSKWLMYHGTTSGIVQPAHANQPAERQSAQKAQWTFQTRISPTFQSTRRFSFLDNVLSSAALADTRGPSTRDGPANLAVPSGQMADDFRGCCGPNNRGMPYRRQALSSELRRPSGGASTSKRATWSGTWSSPNYKHGYSATVAPIVVKDKVIIVFRGRNGIRGSSTRSM